MTYSDSGPPISNSSLDLGGPKGDAPNIAFEYPKDAIVSYSQTHEDVLLWRALHSVTPGFYIDVGAHDPTALSVTRAFYDRGWRGINVEPSPSYAEKLRNERPRDLTLEVALGDSPGIATIYDFGATGLSTIVKEIAEQHLAAGVQSAELRVSVTTLAAVLEDLGDQEVHFLKIDVEGFEWQVLSGADFRKFRPWIVLVEAVTPMTTISSFSAWEPLLLEAGYHFAYFDGLNRFYVSHEHLDLKRYFSAPVGIFDPFRDYEEVRLSDAVAALERDKREQVNELARLSGIVAGLERDKFDRVKHEVPRLGGSTQACDSRDAAGLLRIVEMQASDLLRLRRAILSLPARRSREAEISEWVRLAALADLARIQHAITDVIERSRWRRLGQRLGLAKRLVWETDRWQTDLVKASEGNVPDNDRADAPPVQTLLLELERLNGLLDNFRRSRWRKLGHRLGLAKSQPWESGLWTDPLLLKPFPGRAEHSSSAEVTSGPRGSSYDSFITNRFLKECREFATDVILDVGANTGQFVQALRTQGYPGHVISFEPLSNDHAALIATAESDPLWDIAERCTAGADEGWAEIKIAANFYSFPLPMLDPHRETAPQSEYLGKERCRVITLDSYIERTFSDPTTLFGVKIGTQGYEAEALAGLKRNHNRVKVILCEMAVAPLYTQGPSINELCHLLAELNYRCVALSPEFEDPRTGGLLQANGVFVKRS